MSLAEFARPAQVLFKQVNMSKVTLGGTNLRGARFEEVQWSQVTPRRKGLYDEIALRDESREPTEGELQTLEEAYRYMRVALEDNRSYAAATDFYVGEMEANRKRQKGLGRYLSVVALYRGLSHYGTSVWVAVGWLVAFFVLHLGVTAALQSPTEADLTCSLSELGARSFRLMLLQAESNGTALPHPVIQSWVDASFRVVAVIQIALVVFAFRGKIKRY
jgi:hypothetical protein